MFKATVMPSDKMEPAQLEALRLMIGMIPIVMAKRAGGELRIPSREIDASGDSILHMNIDHSSGEPVFVFTIAPMELGRA